MRQDGDRNRLHVVGLEEGAGGGERARLGDAKQRDPLLRRAAVELAAHVHVHVDAVRRRFRRFVP